MVAGRERVGSLSDAVEEVAMAQLDMGCSHQDWLLF
jgi:hypothetical protein